VAVSCGFWLEVAALCDFGRLIRTGLPSREDSCTGLPPRRRFQRALGSKWQFRAASGAEVAVLCVLSGEVAALCDFGRRNCTGLPPREDFRTGLPLRADLRGLWDRNGSFVRRRASICAASDAEVAVLCVLSGEVAVLCDFGRRNCTGLPPREDFRTGLPPRGGGRRRRAPSPEAAWGLPDWEVRTSVRWRFNPLILEGSTTESGNRHPAGRASIPAPQPVRAPHPTCTNARPHPHPSPHARATQPACPRPRTQPQPPPPRISTPARQGPPSQ